MAGNQEVLSQLVDLFPSTPVGVLARAFVQCGKDLQRTAVYLSENPVDNGGGAVVATPSLVTGTKYEVPLTPATVRIQAEGDAASKSSHALPHPSTKIMNGAGSAADQVSSQVEVSTNSLRGARSDPSTLFSMLTTSAVSHKRGPSRPSSHSATPCAAAPSGAASFPIDLSSPARKAKRHEPSADRPEAFSGRPPGGLGQAPPHSGDLTPVGEAGAGAKVDQILAVLGVDLGREVVQDMLDHFKGDSDKCIDYLLSTAQEPAPASDQAPGKPQLTPPPGGRQVSSVKLEEGGVKALGSRDPPPEVGCLQEMFPNVGFGRILELFLETNRSVDATTAALLAEVEDQESRKKREARDRGSRAASRQQRNGALPDRDKGKCSLGSSADDVIEIPDESSDDVEIIQAPADASHAASTQQQSRGGVQKEGETIQAPRDGQGKGKGEVARDGAEGADDDVPQDLSILGELFPGVDASVIGQVYLCCGKSADAAFEMLNGSSEGDPPGDASKPTEFAPPAAVPQEDPCPPSGSGSSQRQSPPPAPWALQDEIAAAEAAGTWYQKQPLVGESGDQRRGLRRERERERERGREWEIQREREREREERERADAWQYPGLLSAQHQSAAISTSLPFDPRVSEEVRHEQQPGYVPSRAAPYGNGRLGLGDLQGEHPQARHIRHLETLSGAGDRQNGGLAYPSQEWQHVQPRPVVPAQAQGSVYGRGGAPGGHNALYAAHRREAFDLKNRRKEHLDRARELRSNGQRFAAEHHSRIAQELDQQARAAMARGGDNLFVENQRRFTNHVSMDLHGLHLNEVYDKVKPLLSLLCAGALSAATLITGRGNHSEGGQAKIKPYVISLLKEERLVWEEQAGGGALYVRCRAGAA